jgi:hypothetical protein
MDQQGYTVMDLSIGGYMGFAIDTMDHNVRIFMEQFGEYMAY